MSGRQLEKYELLEEVGQGGMAVVYRGMDTALNREVAVKVLHPHLAKEQESKQRFQREAHAVAKLRHDNILEIYDYSGINSEESFIVTEFIHGQTLKAFLARNAISHPEIAAMLVVETCKALAHAHGLGVIHRDIKPENIMIRNDGRVKLTDFGIAQMVDVQKLTVTGQLLGSPAYMAPELVKGKPLDFRTDVFSVGTLLYQLATGEMPFKGRNPHEVLKRIADGNFITPEIANPVVDSQLGTIIRRSLAHEPDARYQGVEELHDALVDYLLDVDIDEPRKELAAYFAGTSDFSDELQRRIVATLVRKGKAALHGRHGAKALQFFDRALCLDPRNSEVLALIGRVARRQRLGQIALIAALVVALVGGIYLVAELVPTGGSTTSADARIAAPPLDARPRDQRSPSKDQSPSPADSARVTPDGPRPDTQKRPLTKRPPIKALRPALVTRRKVELIPTPKAMTIFIGKRKVGDYGPDLRVLELPPGPATLVFRNDACCFEKRIKVGAGPAPLRLRVKLPWKPGRVRVDLEPRVDAAIAVGKIVARAGQLVSVPIPESSTNGRVKVSVRVTAAGYAPVSREVKVQANGTQRVKIALKRNGQ